MRNRGVSDVLGYVLIFAIIIATVGVIYTAGFANLQETRTTERVNNVERALHVMDENVEMVAAGHAPARGTMLRVGDGTLGFGSDVTVNVSVDGRSYRVAVTPLVVEVANSRLVYANGAVLRGRADSSVLLDRPPLVVGDRTVVPMLDTYSAERRTASGTVRVLLEAVSRDVVRFETNATDTAVLTVTSPRASAWADGLDDYENVSCSATGPTAHCTITSVEVVVLQVVSLNVDLT